MIYNLSDYTMENMANLAYLQGMSYDWTITTQAFSLASSTTSGYYIIKLYCPLSNSFILRDLLKGDLEIQVDFNNACLLTTTAASINDLSLVSSEVIVQCL